MGREEQQMSKVRTAFVIVQNGFMPLQLLKENAPFCKAMVRGGGAQRIVVIDLSLP